MVRTEFDVPAISARIMTSWPSRSQQVARKRLRLYLSIWLSPNALVGAFSSISPHGGPARDIGERVQGAVDAVRGDFDLMNRLRSGLHLDEIQRIWEGWCSLSTSNAAVGPLGHHLQGTGGAAHDAQRNSLNPACSMTGSKGPVQMCCRRDGPNQKPLRGGRPADHTTNSCCWDGALLRLEATNINAGGGSYACAG